MTASTQLDVTSNKLLIHADLKGAKHTYLFGGGIFQKMDE